MYGKFTLLLAAALAVAGSAAVASAMPFASNPLVRTPQAGVQSEDGGFTLVQNRARGGGGQRGGANAQRPASRPNRGGGFNSNDFHQNVSNTRNSNVNRNVNVNTNRNVNVSGGGCCYGNYNTGPNWTGVAAGVAVGAMVGAAASSAASAPAYAAPPPTYPPGYVSPPPY